MSNLVIIYYLAFILFLHPSHSFSADAGIQTEVDKVAKKVGCSKPETTSAIKGKLFGQKTETVLFKCKEFTPKRPAYPNGALVISGPENHCPEFIQDDNGLAIIKIIPAKDGFGLGAKYGDLYHWIHQVDESRKYIGKKRKEFLRGNIIENCRDPNCTLTYTYVCAGSDWLFLGHD